MRPASNRESEMFKLKVARGQASYLTQLHGRPYVVMQTPHDAQCNQAPFDTFNTGRFIAVDAAEAADYAAGGCRLMEEESGK
ncbi:MAG: hypothetical protein DMF06_05135 [Verrucomicrobia bacterium]|nr:MAG: hypothetical protein DMF06_05135 [Verrucomicrobiota bacterium]